MLLSEDQSLPVSSEAWNADQNLRCMGCSGDMDAGGSMNMIVAETQCPEPELILPRRNRLPAETPEQPGISAAKTCATPAAPHNAGLNRHSAAKMVEGETTEGRARPSAKRPDDKAKRDKTTPGSGKMHTFTRQKRKTPESAPGAHTDPQDRCKRRASDLEALAGFGSDLNDDVSDDDSDDTWRQIAAGSLPQKLGPHVTTTAAKANIISMQSVPRGTDASAKAVQESRAASQKGEAAAASGREADVSKLPASRKLRGAAGKATTGDSKPEKKPSSRRAGAAPFAPAAGTPKQPKKSQSERVEKLSSRQDNAVRQTPASGGRTGSAAEAKSSEREVSHVRPGTAERRRIPSRLQPWSCGACTLENPSAATHCEACSTAKPPPTSASGGGDSTAQHGELSTKL
jgi:hypothetical protein